MNIYPTNAIENNLKTYYDWALLKIGAWSEVGINTVSAYGDYSTLRVVDDPNYTDGQVWEAPRKDFVWESNINYVDTTGGVNEPSDVGIPQVGGVPATTGTYYIDYPQGKVIFDTPISTSAEVKLAYPYRYVQIYQGDDIPDWQETQFNSYILNDGQFSQFGSGEWSLFGEQRAQFPLVVVQVVGGSVSAWEIGTAPNNIHRQVEFNIMAETKEELNNLVDIFSLQTERKIPFFNTQELVNNEAFPLNYRGELVGSIGYEEFVAQTGYFWGICEMKDASVVNTRQIHPQLYAGLVRTTMSIIA